MVARIVNVASFEVRDAAFRRLVPEDAIVERVAAGFGFTEGPVWRGDHLLFSDIPNNRIVRWRPLPEGPEVITFRAPACPILPGSRVGGSNGLTLDAQGRLLACEHGARRVTRTEPDGTVVTVAESYQGRHLNSPNDIVARPDGSLYFTDPPYGIIDGDQSLHKEMPCNAVLRRDPDGRLTILADDFERPNGLAIAPDGRTLYVDDTARGHIRAFDLRADGTIGNGRLVADIRAAEPGVPDGMKLDAEGNVWCTGAGGVWVIAPDGTVLGRLLMPEVTANLAWGGDDHRTLFLTGSTSLYRLVCTIAGQPLSAV
jgi:gluconolactonase